MIYGVQLICNITVIDLPTSQGSHLSTAATLPWETIHVRNDNFQSYRPKLNITVAV